MYQRVVKASILKKVRIILSTRKIIIVLLVAFVCIEALFVFGVQRKSPSIIESCVGKNINQEQCWQDTVKELLSKKGISKTFDYLEQMSQSDPKFAAACHGLAHEVGREAYQIYKHKKDGVFSAKAFYCGYGFYHGFMETLLIDTKDITKAKEYCMLAQKKLNGYTVDAVGACYHGIGHGLVGDVPSPNAWGKPQAVVQPGLDICSKIFTDKQDLFRCASGAFNALEIHEGSGLYGLKYDVNDVFSICKVQDEKFKKACYAQFVVPLLAIKKNNIKEAVDYIQTLSEKSYIPTTMESAVVEWARLYPQDISGIINLCRTVEPQYHLHCVRYASEGYLKYGIPGQEYLGSMKYCSNSQNTEEEKKACFGYFLSLLRIWYDVDKSAQICKQVPEKYRSRDCIFS